MIVAFAQARLGRHGVGAGDGGNDPLEAAQSRGAGGGQRAAVWYTAPEVSVSASVAAAARQVVRDITNSGC